MVMLFLKVGDNFTGVYYILFIPFVYLNYSLIIFEYLKNVLKRY